jgi:hypothetical protein
MGKTDYLPANVLAYQQKVHNIRAQVTVHQNEWDISAAAVAPLDPLIANFDAAIVVSENPETRTSAAIRRRNETWDALDPVFRTFIQGRLINNAFVPDDALVAMGLPVHDHKPSPKPVPKDTPIVNLSTPAPGIVEAGFSGKNERGHAKPDGVHGMEVRWILAETPPVDWSELTHSEFATRSPLRMTFEGHDRGKWIYMAARWENTRGEKGPWTDIISAVIP